MWAALAGAILFEVIGTLALRASEGFRKRIWIIPVSIGYLASFYLLWLTLGGWACTSASRTASGPRAVSRWLRSLHGSSSANR